MPENEFVFMTLASKLGLNVPRVFLFDVNEHNSFYKNSIGRHFAIERFGISLTKDGYKKDNILDFSSFLDQKVLQQENELKRLQLEGSDLYKYAISTEILFKSMEIILSEKDMHNFAQYYLFGYLIRNTDMHAKNFNLKYDIVRS